MSEALKKAVGLVKLLNDEFPTVEEDSGFTPDLARNIIKMYGSSLQLLIDEHVKLLMLNQEAVEVVQECVNMQKAGFVESLLFLQDWNEGALTELHKDWPEQAERIDHRLMEFAADLPTCVKH